MSRIACVVVLLVASIPVAAGDWPHVRGPDLDGRARHELAPVGSGEFGLLWLRKLGQGYSGIVIYDGVAFTQTQDSRGQYLVAFDVATGREEWKTRYEDPWQRTGAWPGPYASPSLTMDLVCFAGCHGSVGCADITTGKIRWQRDARTEFDGRGTNFGYAASPLIHDDLVILPIGGPSAGIVAFDLETGDTRWTSGGDEAGYTGSIAIDVGGATQIINSMAEAVVAVDPSTGRELWRHRLRDTYNPHPAWLPFEAPHLLIPLALRHGSSVLRLDPGSGLPVDTVWDSRVLSNDVFSSVVVDGFVYGFDIHDPQTSFDGPTKGEFKCVELANGRERWSTTRTGGASVVTDGRLLYLMTEAGSLLVVEATPEAYREQQRLAVVPGSLSWTPPALGSDALLVRGGDYVAALGIGASGADVAVPTPTRAGAWSRWASRARAPSFSGPEPRDLLVWFLAGLVCLVAAVTISVPIRAHPVAAGLIAGETVLLGAVAFPIFTELASTPVFTWPCVLFGGLLAVVWRGNRAREHRTTVRGWVARLSLLGFVGLCAIYDAACSEIGFLAGRGFLVGLLPALPFVLLGVQRVHRHRWWEWRRHGGGGLRRVLCRVCVDLPLAGRRKLRRVGVKDAAHAVILEIVPRPEPAQPVRDPLLSRPFTIRPTAQHAGGASRCRDTRSSPRRSIAGRSPVVVVPDVLDPLPDISAHVVQAELVRFERGYGGQPCPGIAL